MEIEAGAVSELERRLRWTAIIVLGFVEIYAAQIIPDLMAGKLLFCGSIMAMIWLLPNDPINS